MSYRRLRDLREDHDLLQKDLAEYLNCSQVCYSHYEIGKRDIPTDVLIKLADFYNTSIDYLLGRTDEKQSYPKAIHTINVSPCSHTTCSNTNAH